VSFPREATPDFNHTPTFAVCTVRPPTFDNNNTQPFSHYNSVIFPPTTSTYLTSIMPTNSPFPDIPIPATDLWSFIFDRPDRDFSDDKVIYRAVDSSRNHTFADVKRLATTFGQGLLECWNWQKDEVLALYAPNDIDVGPVIYGTLYAGGIVTPANPGYSVDELAYQIKNAGARAVVTTAQFLSTAVSAAEKVGIKKECVIILGGVESKDAQHWRDLTPAKQQGMMKRRTANPQDLAFLAYSSGTTGLPKGVMLSHRNIIADLLIMQHAVGHSYSSSSAKFLGVLPFFHIYGLTGLVHQTLHRGIELVVMPAFDMQVFLKAVQSHKITFVYVAPPVLVRLSRDKMVEGWDLSSLEMITSGAAPLTKELVDAVYKRVGVRINQAYGLSETSPLTHTQVSRHLLLVHAKLKW
jgi:4-coumarate--CoA ligase